MQTVAYGSHRDQVLDIHRPVGAPAGRTVVYFHGGFWRPEIDRSHATPFVATLAAAGNTVVSVEYRRPRERRWSAIREDAALALAAVAADPTLPPARVVVGHSAGGQIATWLAASSETELAGAVGLAGCLDLQLAVELDLGDGAVAGLLAGEHESALAGADPAWLEPRCPVVALHGVDDDVVPAALSESYVRAHPARARYVGLERVDHFSIIDPRSPAFGALGTVLDALAPAGG